MFRDCSRVSRMTAFPNIREGWSGAVWMMETIGATTAATGIPNTMTMMAHLPVTMMAHLPVTTIAGNAGIVHRRHTTTSEEGTPIIEEVDVNGSFRATAVSYHLTNLMKPSTRVSCIECQTSILAATAQRTGGKCMPCQTNTRKYRRRRTPEELLAMCTDVRPGKT